MAISFFPKAGNVLICDFRGYISPEMVKMRPVIVVSPNHLKRPGLVTVVPLSNTPPDPVEPYHYKVNGNPVPGSGAVDCWAKCDMVATVSIYRLDRKKISRGNYAVGYVSMEQVREVRRCAALSFGIDFANT